MTENSRKVLNALKAAGIGEKFTYAQMKEQLGFPVMGSIKSFSNKNLVDKFTETVIDENGKTKEVKYFALNETGANYNPDSE